MFSISGWVVFHLVRASDRQSQTNMRVNKEISPTGSSAYVDLLDLTYKPIVNGDNFVLMPIYSQ